MMIFGIWGDGRQANERLRDGLCAAGCDAELVTPGDGRRVHCLLTVWRCPPDPTAVAAWIRLANLAVIDVAVTTRAAGAPADLPIGPGIEWNGDLSDIGRIARWIADLAPVLAEYVRPAVPVVVPMAASAPTRVCATTGELIDALRDGETRFVPAASALLAALRTNRPAAGRTEFAVRSIVDWSFYRRDFVVGEPPVRVLGRGTKASAYAHRSLHDILDDPGTTSLVTVIGEPGSGKSLQLRQLTAKCALDVLRSADPARSAGTFFVPLFDHPAGRPITFEWVEESWSRVVDTTGWCGFREYLADGGAVVLDGYNEVGAHAQSLTRWMLEWRAVVDDCFRMGARRVVVSCRTRDQLIPLRSARGEEPTAVELSPLRSPQGLAIAAARGVAVARDFAAAIGDDPELAEFYSSPFRLQTALDAGAPTIGRTAARLFGLVVTAAVLRERDQLHLHPLLLPERAIACLVAMRGRSGEDPWPLLAELPLIRVLARLARAISRPDGTVVGPVDRARARAVVAEGLRDEGLAEIPSSDVLAAAIDLHVLVEDERHCYGFSHRVLGRLLAAVAVEPDRVLEVGPVGSAARVAPRTERRPAVAAATSAATSGVRGTASVAAQLHGEEFTRRLAAADPLLAARAHAAALLARDSDAARAIRGALTDLLARTESVTVAIDVLEALAGLGATVPVPGSGDPTSAMHRVPAAEWRLGPGIDGPAPRPGAGDLPEIRSEVASARRTIALRAFWIAAGPVTVAEYADFVTADGYRRRELWTEVGWDWRSRRDAVDRFVLTWSRKRDTLRSHPERIVRLVREQSAGPTEAAALVRFVELTDDDLARYARDNFRAPIDGPRFWSGRSATSSTHPVVGISWHEANAFCAWKSRQLGEIVRLPSENEWEAACVWRLRRTPHRGEINSREFGGRGTTPVGAFEVAGRSDVPDIPKDMMGNCTEWTLDHYQPGDPLRRVTKGGSWRQERWRSHPAYRGRGDVDSRTDDAGFRYVVAD